MVDCTGQKVIIGDWVRYWHRRFGASSVGVGQVKAIDRARQTVAIEYSQKDSRDGETTCYRTKAAITRITMGEAMMFTLERNTDEVEAEW